MPGHATIINLLPVSETDEDKIRTVLDLDSITIVQGRDIREKGARGGLNYLREVHREAGSSFIAINSYDWSRQSRRTELYGLACLVPARKRVAIDTKDRVIELTWPHFLFSELPNSIAQKISGAQLLAGTRSRVKAGLERTREYRTASSGDIENILYMRTDLWFGVKAGGSIGHVAGVIDGFKRQGMGVHVLSWDKPPLTGDDTGFTKVSPDSFYINEREMALLAYNGRLESAASTLFENNKPDAIYARYALDCYAPVLIAEMADVPLILEYNGSEVWIEKHWGQGLKYGDVAQDIEDWVLKSAEVITVVSNPLRDELVRKGLPEERVLVNPNCVDPDRFDPDRYTDDEINALKKEIGIPEGAIVVGFIGTFSPWHGVEVLAEAIPIALQSNPRLHFLLIGAGPLFDEIRERLKTAGVLDRVTMTGLVAQEEAPKYLMCSDFFLSPHVPNPDGTPFFGSPTKLFEYMALGKGIIASDLDQLGEVLTHEENALLVQPGNAKMLADAIGKLCDDRGLAEKLGSAARELALREYTWKAHVGRIMERLYSLKNKP